MKRVTIVLLLAASAVAVAQHQQGNVANVPDQKFDTAAHCICLADGHGCQHPTSDTKAACELVGGTWNAPAPAPQTYSVGDYRLSVVVSSDVHVDNNVPGAVYINSQTGRVVKLSDEEYTHLQKLRQAVADEEKKIAAARGVDFGQVYVPAPCIAYDMGCMAWDKTKEVQSRPADHLQFRGQWLFINIPKAAQTEAK